MAVIRKLQPVETSESEDLIRLRSSGGIRKKLGDANDESNWLISYADIMTLLCVFYIMLFSMANFNTPEFEKVKEAVSKEVGVPYTSPTEELGRFLTNVLTEAGVEQQATLSSDGVSVSIAFHSTVFFPSLSAEVSESGRQVLDTLIEKLVARMKNDVDQSLPTYRFVVEGHTDRQNILSGPYPTNWELSSARATRVVRLFIEKGIPPESLMAIGFADTRPVDEDLAKNRRVIVRVLLPGVDTVPFQVGKSDPAKPADVKSSSNLK